MKTRCPWVPLDNNEYLDYHDREWGVPVHNDITHFEFLILEGAQAGLSWETILKRRTGYKVAFYDFDFNRVKSMTDKDVKRLLSNEGIIRNKLKIKSAINNARKFIEVKDEFGSFDKYIWSFVGNKPINHKLKALSDYPTSTKESENLSKDLKSRGFTFVGPTIMYAHMQACGLFNDHTTNCFRHTQV